MPEIQQLKRMAQLRAVQQFLAMGIPPVIAVPVFLLYQSVHGELSASTAFTSVAVFELLNFALAVIPNMLNELRRLTASLNRIGALLAVPDWDVQAAPGKHGVHCLPCKFRLRTCQRCRD